MSKKVFGDDIYKCMGLLSPGLIEFIAETVHAELAKNATSSHKDTILNQVLVEESEEESLAKVIPIDDFQELIEENNIEYKATSGSDILIGDRESTHLKIAREEFEREQLEKDTLNLSKDERKLDSLGIKSKAEVEFLKKQEELERLRTTPSEVVFLLNEKRKVDESNKRLKKFVGYGQYKKNLTINTSKVSVTDELEEKESNKTKGVLIDKNQF